MEELAEAVALAESDESAEEDELADAVELTEAVELVEAAASSEAPAGKARLAAIVNTNSTKTGINTRRIGEKLLIMNLQRTCL